MVVVSPESHRPPASPFEHVVYFYDREDDLVAVVGDYLVDGLRAGDAVVIVVGPSQRRAFESALVAAGIDLPAALADGALLIVDAADTLGRFMVDGTPDAEVLAEVICTMLDHGVTDGRHLRIYGEMVTMLWQAGHVGAALEVERMWNSLANDVPLSLFCAYPSAIAADAETFAAFDDVCGMHSDVIGEMPIPSIAAATRPFSYDLHTPRDARLFVAETLAGWSLHDLIDDALLVVSELTTNAVRHAGSDVVVTVSRTRDGIRVGVADRSGVRPQPRSSGPAVAGGWGMRVVNSIASQWGCDAAHEGKEVWAELDRERRHR